MKIVEVQRKPNVERKEVVEEMAFEPKPLTEQQVPTEGEVYYGLHMGRAGDNATTEEVHSLKRSNPRLFKKIVNMD